MASLPHEKTDNFELLDCEENSQECLVQNIQSYTSSISSTLQEKALLKSDPCTSNTTKNPVKRKPCRVGYISPETIGNWKMRIALETSNNIAQEKNLLKQLINKKYIFFVFCCR